MFPMDCQFWIHGGIPRDQGGKYEIKYKTLPKFSSKFFPPKKTRQLTNINDKFLEKRSITKNKRTRLNTDAQSDEMIKSFRKTQQKYIKSFTSHLKKNVKRDFFPFLIPFFVRRRKIIYTAINPLSRHRKRYGDGE